MASKIVSFFPSCGKTYVEPFAGRGNVFWKAASTLQYQSWWLNDIRTAPFFEAILAVGDTVTIPERALTRQELQPYVKAFQRGDLTAIIAEPYLTHSGRGFLYSGKKGKGGGAEQAGYQNTIRQCHNILHRTSPRITAVDWLQTVNGLGADDFVYLDPPYIKANVGCYSPSDLDHEELVRVLENAPFRWILSEYEHELYTSHFGQPFFKKKMKKQATVGQEDEVECLWKNF